MAEYNGLIINSINPTKLYSSDIVRNARVLASGYLELDGAQAFDTLISGSNAFVNAYSGAELTRTTVADGGLLQVTSPGAPVLSTTVQNSGFFLLSGGTASGTVISENGIECLSDGAVEYGTQINARGIQEVINAKVSGAILKGDNYETGHALQQLKEGAEAYDTTISAYGCQDIASGGIAYDSEIYTYGVQLICAGGIAYNTVMHSGTAEWHAPYQLVEGKAYNTLVYAYSDHYIRHGGIAYDSVIYELAWQTVAEGGMAFGAKIHSGGLQGIYGAADGYGRGEAYDTIVFAGGMQTVESGGYAEQTTVYGTQEVWEKGSALHNSILSGGIQTVYGYAEENDVYSGGKQIIGSRTFSDDTPVSAGTAFHNTFENAEQWITSGGIAENNVFFGGRQIIQGGIANGNVLNQASQDIFGGNAVSTRIIEGYQNIVSGGIASDTVISQGSQTINASAKAYNTVLYGGNAKILEGGYASGTALYQGASMEVWQGGTIDGAVIGTGAVCTIYSGAKWTGGITIGGRVEVAEISGSVDVNFLVAGTPLPDYMLNQYLVDSTYSITVSRYAGTGKYTLINDASGFNRTVSIGTNSGYVYGSLTLGKTVHCGNRDYLLSLEDGRLTLSVSGAAAQVSPTDIDSNGISDLIMVHTRQGYAGAWLIQQNHTAVWGNLSNINGSWEVFGTGKTDEGSSCDIYLYDKVNHNVGAWAVDGSGNVTGWKSIGNFDANTQVLGLGDFDGDEVTDLLLRNINGAVGCRFTSGKDWNYFQSLGSEWSIAGVGDFNGDGIDDMVLKHDAGFAGTWLVNKDGTVSWANLDSLGSGFEIAGCGDFNGDGIDDVLLKKGDYYGAWIVEAGSVKGWMGLGNMSSGNVLEQIGDFNGDGIDDLRIRTAAGDLGTLCVMGEDHLDWNYYGSVGSEWKTSLASV